MDKTLINSSTMRIRLIRASGESYETALGTFIIRYNRTDYNVCILFDDIGNHQSSRICWDLEGADWVDNDWDK